MNIDALRATNKSLKKLIAEKRAMVRPLRKNIRRLRQMLDTARQLVKRAKAIGNAPMARKNRILVHTIKQRIDKNMPIVRKYLHYIRGITTKQKQIANMLTRL